jgi:hypothetical protein
MIYEVNKPANGRGGFGGLMTERRFSTLRATREALRRHLAAPAPPTGMQLLSELFDGLHEQDET